jgi:hypothetical protein
MSSLFKRFFINKNASKENEINTVRAQEFLYILHNFANDFNAADALLMFSIEDIPNVEPVYILLHSWFAGRDDRYDHCSYHRVVLRVAYINDKAPRRLVSDYDMRRIVLYLTQERNDNAAECKYIRLILRDRNNFFDIHNVANRKEKYFLYIDAMSAETMYGIQHRREQTWKNMKKSPQLPLGKNKIK